MDKMQPISQALYSLLFLGCMGAGFPLYVQGQNVDELPPDSIYNIGYARGIADFGSGVMYILK